jgi:hypothetical protein
VSRISPDGLAVGSLCWADLDRDLRRFVDEHLARCNCAPRVQRSRPQVRAALRLLQVVLADSGVETDVRHAGPVDAVLHRYSEHLRQARGLAPSTCLQRLRIVGALVRKAAAATPTPDQLRRFIAQELARVSPASGGAVATALRSYLQFRAFEGDRVKHLLPMIGSPARWRLAPLPQTLSRSEVERLLGALPASLPSRLRSYAIARCVVDLGLRSSEVIKLELDDIDWAAGTLRIVKCKTRRLGMASAKRSPRATVSLAASAAARSGRTTCHVRLHPCKTGSHPCGFRLVVLPVFFASVEGVMC